VDCPSTGLLLDIEQHSTTSATGVVRFKNAICVFEHNENLPLRKHFNKDGEGGFTFVGSAHQTHLVVRYIATVYNYDYVFDWVLQLNGIVEARVRSAG
jgi:primary-amine oxidase